MMAAVSSSQQQLVRELTEHNDFFDMLVDMIPSKLYIAGQSGDDYNPKYYFKAGQSPSSLTEQQQSRSARKAAAKAAKRRKLDPTAVETTVQVKQRLLEEENTTSDLSSTALPKKHDVQDDDDKNKKPSSVEAAASLERSKFKSNKSSSSSSYQSRIETLREKLHTKMAAKQHQQNRPPPDQVSKRAARRAEKRQRRQEQAAAARNNKKLKSSSQVFEQTQYNNAMVTPDSKTNPSLDTLDFGLLSGFNRNNSNSNYMETNKALANLNKSKNIQKLLEDAEAKRLKLQALKQSSNVKDQQKAQAMQWKDTFTQADAGQERRVKDDNPKYLKKALKRKQAKKKKSAKAWKSRLEQTKASMQERQEIRQHNLSARKQGGRVGSNLSKKRIVDNNPGDVVSKSTNDGDDAGRRLSRAGFEGRKQDFLNSGSSSSGKKKKNQ